MRWALDKLGVSGLPASLIHFAALWGTAQVMLPANNVAKPITEWPAQQIAIDVFHHAVYAFAAGAVYDAMRKAERKEEKRTFFGNKLKRN